LAEFSVFSIRRTNIRLVYIKTLTEAQTPASAVKTGIEPTDESADAPTSSSKCS
jgi:hypothetical protein